jgi:hypothetical protein
MIHNIYIHMHLDRIKLVSKTGIISSCTFWNIMGLTYDTNVKCYTYHFLCSIMPLRFVFHYMNSTFTDKARNSVKLLKASCDMFTREYLTTVMKYRLAYTGSFITKWPNYPQNMHNLVFCDVRCIVICFKELSFELLMVRAVKLYDIFLWFF